MLHVAIAEKLFYPVIPATGLQDSIQPCTDLRLIEVAGFFLPLQLGAAHAAPAGSGEQTVAIFTALGQQTPCIMARMVLFLLPAVLYESTCRHSPPARVDSASKILHLSLEISHSLIKTDEIISLSIPHGATFSRVIEG